MTIPPWSFMSISIFSTALLPRPSDENALVGAAWVFALAPVWL
jgi:hypothetical protein